MENQLINLSLCLTDIKELGKHNIKKASNGKLYISVVVRKRKEPDQFGQDIYAVINQSEEQKKAGEAKAYVGNGKLVKFTPEKPEEMAAVNQDDLDDIPF